MIFFILDSKLLNIYILFYQINIYQYEKLNWNTFSIKQFNITQLSAKTSSFFY